MKIIIIIFACLFLFLFPFWLVSDHYDQPEYILSFISEIKINKDGSMNVTETIQVKSAQIQIKRGIYRDFPVIYKDHLGNNVKVYFKMTGAMRNGQPENYHIKHQSKSVRIYLGDKDTSISAGIHTYKISYITSRQLGFFKEWDELYWNVTGNEWVFPINNAICVIELPGNIPAKKIEGIAFTGYKGEKGTDYQYINEGNNTIVLRSTRPLKTYEGLTIAVRWPKGFVKEPVLAQKRQYFINDNFGFIIGIAGVIAVFFYYFLIWLKVGKDPEKGTIIPLFNPPENLSPSALRYIMNMGYDDKCFSSALIDMAVKNYLRIENKKGDYTLRKIGKNSEPLTSDEKKIADELFHSGNSIKIEQSSRSDINFAISGLKDNLKQNFFKKYFYKNTAYLFPGIFISFLVLFLSILLQSKLQGSEIMGAGLFSIFWLSIWTTAVIFLTKQVFSAWRSATGSRKLLSFGSSLGLTLFAIPFWIGEIAGITFLTVFTSLGTLLILVIMVGLAILFHYLFKAPTFIGRKLMDEIDGFRLYLSVTEKDRMNALMPRNTNPVIFEKYLPYALALGVENEWAKQFANAVKNKKLTGQGYAPGWYIGRPILFSNFTSSLNSSLTAALASSTAAPGSSSGFGGGGSSGGGGGGGGGGGW